MTKTIVHWTEYMNIQSRHPLTHDNTCDLVEKEFRQLRNLIIYDLAWLYKGHKSLRTMLICALPLNRRYEHTKSSSSRLCTATEPKIWIYEVVILSRSYTAFFIFYSCYWQNYFIVLVLLAKPFMDRLALFSKLTWRHFRKMKEVLIDYVTNPNPTPIL